MCKCYPCNNGATCNDGVKEYTSICATAYTGVNCETVFWTEIEFVNVNAIKTTVIS